jgi:hypothetical protein
MEVVEGCGDLVGEVLCALLRDREAALLKISEKITTVELLHDDVNVILVLKDI